MGNNFKNDILNLNQRLEQTQADANRNQEQINKLFRDQNNKMLKIQKDTNKRQEKFSKILEEQNKIIIKNQEDSKLKEEKLNNALLEKEKKLEQLTKTMMEHQKRMQETEKKYREENEKKTKENNKTIQLLIEQHEKTMQIVKDNALTQAKILREKQEKSEEEFKKALENIQKKYKEERDEEKRKQLEEEQKKIRDLKEKKEKAEKEFNEKLIKILNDKIEEIIKSFNSIEDKFCLEEISKFDKAKIKTLIRNLVKIEKIGSYLSKQLKIIMDTVKYKMKRVEHLNIILVGPSGVGKSTLINVILELQKKTETGFGKPQTQSIEFFTSDNLPFLRLADSKGIEKAQISGVDATYNSIKDFIKKQIETRDPDKYIHCIWYCWTGARLEESEIEILKKLSKQYTLKTLPVIIVYTNAINKKFVDEGRKYISEELKLNNEFIPILSLETEINAGDKEIKISPFGLDKLKEISIKLAMGAINSACYDGLTKDIKNHIKEKISNLSEDLKIKINSFVKDILSKINEDIKIEDIYKDLNFIILNLFYKYLYIDPKIEVINHEKPEIQAGKIKYEISESTQMIVKDFVMDYFKECMNSLDDSIKKILKKESEKSSKEIYTFQLEYNLHHENLLDVKTTTEMEYIIKDQINSKLYKKAKLASIKNSFQYIVIPIIELLGLYFDELYKQCMLKKDFEENVNKIIKVPFDNIQKKIKDYEERKKKEDKEKKKKENEEKNNSQEAPPPFEKRNKNFPKSSTSGPNFTEYFDKNVI